LTTFEPILLKKLMYNGEFFRKMIPVLESKYFIDSGNQKLFDLIKQYYVQYKNIPTITEIVTSVKNVPNEELRRLIIEKLQVISKTEEVQNTEFMLEESIKFVKNAIFTEALIMGSDAIQEKNEEKITKSKALMEEMSKISIDSDLGLDFDNIEEMIKYYQDKLVGILTSHPEFNKRLGTGFLPKTLSVIAAATGVGKSLLMTDLISGMLKDGKNILIVSMEMQDKEMMKRIHANTLNLKINELQNLSPDNIRIAFDNFKKNEIGKLMVKEYPTGSFSPLMLDGLIDAYKIEKNIEFDIVFLDYLGIMKSDLITPSAGLYSYLKSIVEETRSIAVQRNIPIVSASQLNRSGINNTEVGMDSISDSIGTVQTADFILFLLQTEQMKEEKVITCKCTKNRFTGRTDQWNMDVNYDFMRFTDCVVQGSGLTEKEADDMIAEQKAKDMGIIKEIDKSNSIQEDFDVMSELGLS